MIGDFLVNGESTDGLVPATDSSVVRGDGCFEVMRFYEGVPFAMDQHLDRLAVSAKSMDLDLPARGEIEDWVLTAARGESSCLVRVLVTRGSAIPGFNHGPLVVVYAFEAPQVEGPATLVPVPAPWHAAGEEWALSSAKVLSYAPNVATTRRANELGFDEGLMISREGHILEGPTSAVAWMLEGILETPTLGLGILDSITRRAAISLAEEYGIDVVEGRWGLDRLGSASEVMVMSTVREIQSVTKVGDLEFEEGPVCGRLSEGFARLTGG